MDISRPDIRKRKQKRNLLFLLGFIGLVVLGSIAIARMEPAAPTVDRSILWTGRVERGEMLREVRGNGTLVPTRILSIQSVTGGTIEAILIWPGAEVEPGSVIIKLSNPELEKEIFDLTWQLRAAEATQRQMEAENEQNIFIQESTIAIKKSDWSQAELEAEASESLSEQQLEPAIKVKAARARSDALKILYDLEVRKLEILQKTSDAKLEVQQADLEKIKAQLKLKQQHFEALNVKAGIRGVLQQLGSKEPLQIGQRVSAGTSLAKVVQPEALKAVIRVPETQAKDIQIGQTALIDTRNGWVKGRVGRVDPAVIEGTVTLDITLLDSLPQGARPDMAVDAKVEIERLQNVLYVGRMVNSQPEVSTEVFRLTPEGDHAKRTAVKIGRTSASTMEIREGLQEGDEIILSEISRWEDVDKINIEH